MREKMARAMFTQNEDSDITWDTCPQEIRDEHLASAAAALAAMEELFATAAECADDLAAHLDAEHQHRDRYPTIQRNYDRDMDVVVRLRAMIGAAKGKG